MLMMAIGVDAFVIKKNRKLAIDAAVTSNVRRAIGGTLRSRASANKPRSPDIKNFQNSRGASLKITLR